MDTIKKAAIIIGGGIGGPVAALFLKRAGIDAHIYEAQPAPDDNQGYFLVAKDGGVFTFGSAVFKGSTGDMKLMTPPVPAGDGQQRAAQGETGTVEQRGMKGRHAGMWGEV